jgi:uncharacterized protein
LKILIDINHPAHVHYFKNMIKIMKQKEHDFRVISRNKEIEHYLLDKYEIDYISRGIGKKSTLGKAFYFFYATYFLLKHVILFKPDVVISFGTPYPAIASWIMRKPHVSVNDTEHAKMHHLLTDPFSKTILTPSCYNIDLGPKQIRFEGYMELSYLNKKYYNEDKTVFDLLKIPEDSEYVIFRFVSWNAVHDQGHSGISLENKIRVVKKYSELCKVFISSEAELPAELEKYRIQIPPEKMHDVLNYATLFFGESATMASECACLGTPAIYLDNDGRGYTDEEETDYGLVFNFSESADDQVMAIEKGFDLLINRNNNVSWKKNHKKLLDDKIDVTAFFIWFFENYPNSIKIMKEDQDYQYKFK